jgi:hypothetical protein
MSDFMSNTTLKLPGRFTSKPRFSLNGDAQSASPLDTPSSLGATTDFGFDTKLTSVDPSLSAEPVRPGLGGGWTSGVGTASQIANVGLGIYSALEQSKMNQFMRGYYGNEMARNKADFNNNVTSTNAALDKQARTSASQNGFAFGTAGNNAAAADAMSKWGVQKFE